MRFSANLGFLWADRPLADAIRAAAAAGFDAVECHYPYDQPAGDVRAALTETGLPMLGLNTARGDVAAGETGLAAVPGREAEARGLIDQAFDYAEAVGAEAVHVMCGTAEGDRARDVFLRNLAHACDRAEAAERMVLIEALNPWDAPGYFLGRTEEAVRIIEALGHPRLKLMFDCYHVGRVEGDVLARLDALWPVIGHIQFAAVPDRGPPDHGEVDYAEVFGAIAAAGWTRPLGAEYRPGGPTEQSLGWMRRLTDAGGTPTRG